MQLSGTYIELQLMLHLIRFPPFSFVIMTCHIQLCGQHDKAVFSWDTIIPVCRLLIEERLIWQLINCDMLLTMLFIPGLLLVPSGVGGTKALFVNISIIIIFDLAKESLISFESHLYLTSATAAQPWRHLSNIKVIFNSLDVCILTMLKNSEYDGMEEIGLVTPTPDASIPFHKGVISSIFK